MEILKRKHVLYLSLCMLSLWFGIVIYTAFANLDVEDAVYFSQHPLIAVEELLRGWKDTSEDLANQFDEEVKQQLSQQFYDSLHKETMEHIESLKSFKPTPKHDTFAEEKKKNEVLRNWLNEKTEKQITKVSVLRKKKEKIMFIRKKKWKHKNIKRKITPSKLWPTKQVVNFTLKLNFETATNSKSITLSKAAINATTNLIRAQRNKKSATATTNRKIQENLHTPKYFLYSLTETKGYSIDNEKKDFDGYSKGNHTENTLELVTSKEQIDDEKEDGSKEDKPHNKITYSNDERTEMNVDTEEVKDDEHSKTTPVEDDLDSKTEEENEIENEESSKNKEERENTNNYEENTLDTKNMNIHEHKENIEKEIENKLKDKEAFVENLNSNQNDEELNLNNVDPGIDETEISYEEEEKDNNAYDMVT